MSLGYSEGRWFGAMQCKWRVELPHPHLVFPRAGASPTLRHHSGDGEERHTGGEATVLVRRPVLLQRLLLGPAEHQEPRRAGDGR